MRSFRDVTFTLGLKPKVLLKRHHLVTITKWKPKKLYKIGYISLI